jgi:rare lipoprotein A
MISLSQFPRGEVALKAAVAIAAGAALTGCAQRSQQVAASSGSYGFSPSKYGVAASPRVVEEGQEVPKGGGRYQVGKSYTVAGKTYHPSERAIVQTGTASWYGRDFHGRKTANGEIFDRNSITAAHPTMPLPSYARVTNLRNNYSMIVRVNDRGPYHGGRVMDVSQRVADALDFRHHGTARIRLEYMGKAGLGGSDDSKLMASLRTDGQPAYLDGMPRSTPTMVAEKTEEPKRVAHKQESESAAEAQSAEVDDAPAKAKLATLKQTKKSGKTIAPKSQSAEDDSDGAPEVAAKHGARTTLAYAEAKGVESKGAPAPLARPTALGAKPARSAPAKPQPLDDQSED